MNEHLAILHKFECLEPEPEPRVVEREKANCLIINTSIRRNKILDLQFTIATLKQIYENKVEIVWQDRNLCLEH